MLPNCKHKSKSGNCATTNTEYYAAKIALVNAHGNPIAAPNPGPAPTAAAQLIDVNQLKTAIQKPTSQSSTEIPLCIM